MPNFLSRFAKILLFDLFIILYIYILCVAALFMHLQKKRVQE